MSSASSLELHQAQAATSLIVCISSLRPSDAFFYYFKDKGTLLFPILSGFAFFGRRPHLRLTGDLEEAREEVTICSRNPVQCVLNILQFYGVEAKNGVKYSPGGVMRILELTYLNLPPNGRLQLTLAKFGCVAIPVHRCQDNAMRCKIG